jgi:hypothetical protein
MWSYCMGYAAKIRVTRTILQEMCTQYKDKHSTEYHYRERRNWKVSDKPDNGSPR